MRYSLDPRWINARFAGIDAKGQPFKTGERVFYFPNGKKILAGENAEQAARDFEAALFDEGAL